MMLILQEAGTLLAFKSTCPGLEAFTGQEQPLLQT